MMNSSTQEISQHDSSMDRRYSKEHTWAEQAGETLVIGITDFAQAQLGDVIFIELPAVGDTFDRDHEFGIVESAKSTSELIMPVSGEILEINALLEGEPTLINQSPYRDGWIIRVKPGDPSEFDSLLSGPDYEAFLEAEE